MKLRLPLAALLLSVAPGCLATSAQVTSLESRVVTLERAHTGFLLNAERETKRLQTLAGDVEQSNAALRESLARSGAKLADFDTKLQKTRGELEVVAHRLEVVEKTGGGAADQIAEVRRRLEQLIADLRDRAGIAILALPSDLPADADGFAKLADAKFAAGEVRTAVAVATECQKRFANTEAAGQCGIVLAKVAVQEQRYADATRTLQAVHDSLGGKAVPVVGAALLEIAHVLELQGRCANAQKVFKYLISDMPKLAATKTAKEQLASSATRCKEGQGATGKGEEAASDAPAPDKPAADKPAADKAETPAVDKADKSDKADKADKAEKGEKAKPAADKPKSK